MKSDSLATTIDLMRSTVFWNPEVSIVNQNSDLACILRMNVLELLVGKTRKDIP